MFVTNKILVYDFNGEYLKTIIPPKDEIGQFIMTHQA